MQQTTSKRKILMECIVKHCPNNSENNRQPLFRLPNSMKRFKEWLTICHRDDIAVTALPMDYTIYKICGEHFTDDMFVDKTRKELQRFATPNIITPPLMDNMEIKEEEIVIKSEDEDEQVGMEVIEPEYIVEFAPTPETSNINLNGNDNNVVEICADESFHGPRVTTVNDDTNKSIGHSRHVRKQTHHTRKEDNDDVVPVIEEDPLVIDTGVQISSQFHSNVNFKLPSQLQSSSGNDELVDFDDLLMKPDDIIIKPTYQIQREDTDDKLDKEANPPPLKKPKQKRTPIQPAAKNQGVSKKTAKTNLQQEPTKNYIAITLPKNYSNQYVFSVNNQALELQQPNSNKDHSSLEPLRSDADQTPISYPAISIANSNIPFVTPLSTAPSRFSVPMPLQGTLNNQPSVPFMSSIATPINRLALTVQTQAAMPSVATMPTFSMAGFCQSPTQPTIQLIPVSSSSELKTPSITPISKDLQEQLSDSSTDQPPLDTKELLKMLRQLSNKNCYLQNKIDKITREHERNIQQLRIEQISLSDYRLLTHRFCPSEELANFINVQITENNKNPRGRRYSEEFKMSCLSLYFESPGMYKKLLKKFCMPSVLTLTRFLKSINFSSGVDKNIFKILGKKTENFKPSDKSCVICFDEIKLKPQLYYAIDSDRIVGFEDSEISGKQFKLATSATVIIAKGLNSSWKQPIAYYLANKKIPVEKLKEMLFSIISNLEEIGLSVFGLVCNMNRNTLNLCEHLKVSEENPYFKYQNENKAFLFDVPHLLTLLRNELMRYDFCLNENIISWRFIKEMYEHDQFFPDSRALSLTESHMMPNKEEKQKVKFAAQVFSSSVATSMNHYIRFNQLPSEAAQTETFIRDMDHLFDFLNSSVKVGKTVYRNAYNFSQDHNALLRNYYSIFKQLEVRNSNGKNITSSIKCIDGWKITISSFMFLGSVLQNKGVSFLLTRRVNNDCMRKMFTKMSQLNKNHSKLTPMQVIRGFRKLFRFEIIGGKSCELKDSKENDSQKSVPLDTDYRSMKSLESNFSENFGPYLMRKCVAKHSCSKCMAFACEYLNNKKRSCEYANDSNILLFSHTRLADLLHAMDIIFEINFNLLCPHPKFAKKMVEALCSLKFVLPCPRFHYVHLCNIYVRVKLYYMIKKANSDKTDLQNLFSYTAIVQPIQPIN